MNYRLYQLIVFILFFGIKVSFGQCVQTLDETEKAELAEIVCDATVLAKDYYMSQEDAHIYTTYLLQINSTHKGLLKTDSIQLIQRGGQWNDLIEVVHPSMSLQLGDKGYFYLKENTKVLSPNHAWSSLASFEGAIGSQSFLFKDHSANRIDHPIIESFSPTSIEAGTASLLTINGLNFGNNANGLAKVKFRNPDFYNITFSYQSLPPNHIISWSDTLIQVLVPGNDPLIGHSGAGSGPIRVINSNGGENESADSLKVYVNKLVLGLQSVHLINQNGYGGYTLTYNDEFHADESARAATERALQTWQCSSSQSNLLTNDQTSTANCAANDQINLIAYDNDCELAPTTLAETTHWIYSCDNEEGIIIEMDIIINSNINWNNGPNESDIDQKDLESLILHELGHVQGLAHVSDFYATMYPAQYNGIDEREIDSSGILCANLIKDHSQIANCNYSNFSPYIEASLITDPITQTCVLDTLDHNINSPFSIYPNPITDNQALEISGVPLNNTSQFLNFRLHSVNGQLLFEEQINTHQAYTLNPAIINQLSVGMYILSIESDEQFYQKKFVKW